MFRRAEGDGNEPSTPYNAPQRGPTRQQRAAMVSEEVKMIQRDHPSPSFGESDPNTLRPAGAGETVDPEAIGEDVRPGSMGENDAASREGPSAQGTGRDVEAVEDVHNDSRLVRGEPSTQDTALDPAGGETSVMDATSGVHQAGLMTRSLAQDDREREQEPMNKNDGTGTQSSMQSTPTVAFQPDHPTRHELLDSSYSPSTIAGGAFENVIEERMKAVAGPAEHQLRETRHLAHKMMSGQFVHFASKEEKAAAEDEAKKIASQKAVKLARKKRLDSGEVQPAPSNYEFRPLPKAAQNTLINRMVAGKYNSDGLLSRNEEETTTSSNQLFVGRLDAEVTQNDLLQAFSACSGVADAFVMRHVSNNISRGYGFVTFETRADAENAQKSMDGAQLGSKSIRCEFVKEKRQSNASQQMYKQTVLQQVGKVALKNGTYLTQDRDRLVRKVQSLLPAQQTQRSGKLREKVA